MSGTSRAGGAVGPESTAPAGDAHDAVDRLRQDWLAVLLDRLVRAAGLLQPDHAADHHRLSLSEWFALTELAEEAPLSQRDLASRLRLEKSTVSRLVAGLERRGLVTRRRNPDNRRFFHVAITDHGRAVLGGHAGAMLERHARISAAMTSRERDALVTGVSALARAMEQT